MCGFAGLWRPSPAPRRLLEAHARAMADAIAHRGPDDGGAWADAEAGLALAHRRLAILDLCRPSADAQRLRALRDRLQR